MSDDKDKIIFSCPNCGRKLSVGGDKAGISALCPACGKRVKIPGQTKK